MSENQGQVWYKRKEIIIVGVLIPILAILIPLMYNILKEKPDFSVSFKEDYLKKIYSGTINNTTVVEIESVNNFKGKTVSLIVDEKPNYVDVSFDPSSGKPNFSSRITIKVDENAKPGECTIKFKAAGNDTEKNFFMCLDIIKPETPDSEEISTPEPTIKQSEPTEKPKTAFSISSCNRLFNEKGNFSELYLDTNWINVPPGYNIYFFVGNSSLDKYYLAKFWNDTIWVNYSTFTGVTSTGTRQVILGDFLFNNFSNDSIFVSLTKNNFKEDLIVDSSYIEENSWESFMFNLNFTW